MEPLNNDMDDLFRKAGDQYPLKISESDWDGVLGRLRDDGMGDSNTTPLIKTGGDRKKRRWLLLFFIPLVLGSTVYFFTANKPSSGSLSTSNNKGHADISLKKDLTDKLKEGKNALPEKSSEDISLSGQSSLSAGLSGSQKTNGLSSAISVSTNKYQGKIHGEFQPNEGPQLQKNLMNHPGGTKDSKLSVSNNNYTDLSSLLSQSFKEPVAKSVSLTVYVPVENVSVFGTAFTAASSKTFSLKTGTPESVKMHKSNKFLSNRGLYLGILAGPDISSVDFQSIKQPGFSVGILLGYRFNQRLSVETGLLWDKKYYYSNGSYFDKSNTSIPSNESIKDLNGYCNMFEIPVALRYDFVDNKKHGYFVKAGLSSYLMTKEAYMINAQSTGWSGSYSYSYNSSTKNILSIVQVSAGYEYAISGKTKVRIEPYLKIPLQGIGVGSMPISSAGLYLGISHSFR
jgi:Outer membrane protein beta-barrel domain